MIRFAAKHPLLAAFLLTLAHGVILDISAEVAVNCRLLVWHPAYVGPYAGESDVLTGVAFGWALLVAGAVALCRARSGASAWPLVALTAIIPFQIFAQTTIMGCLYYGGYMADWDVGQLLPRAVGILDDVDIMAMVGWGLPWAAAGAAVGIILALWHARDLRNSGYWQMIVPVPLPCASAGTWTAVRAMLLGGLVFAAIEIAVFVVLMIPVYAMMANGFQSLPYDGLYTNHVGSLWLAMVFAAAFVTTFAMGRPWPRRGTGRTLRDELLCAAAIQLILVTAYLLLLSLDNRPGINYWHGLWLFMSMLDHMPQTWPEPLQAAMAWSLLVLVSSTGMVLAWGLMELRARRVRRDSSPCFFLRKS